jgi:hypothetical protein
MVMKATRAHVENGGINRSWRLIAYFCLLISFLIMMAVYHKHFLSTLIHPLSQGYTLESASAAYIVAACLIALFLKRSGGVLLALALLPFIGNLHFAMLRQLSLLRINLESGVFLLDYQGGIYLVFTILLSALIMLRLKKWYHILIYNLGVALSVSVILYQNLVMEHVF